MFRRVVRGLLLWGMQLGLLLWLLWWMLLASVPFNEYWDSSSSVYVFDCDRETELVAALGMIIIWLTTAVVVGISFWLRFWRRCKMLWFINAIAFSLSLASIVRFHELVVYNQELQNFCP